MCRKSKEVLHMVFKTNDFIQKYFRTLTETENLTVKKMPQIKVLEIFAFLVYNKSLLCAT